MDRIKRDTLLGFVFFGTLGFLLWATVNLTDLSLNNELVVYFPNGGSADVGTNVMVLGKKVGKVGAIDIDYDRPDAPVRMSLLLREQIPLKDDHVIEVRDAGVLGGKQVYIDPGRGALLAGGTVLSGGVAGSAFDKLGNIADGEGVVGQRLDESLTAIRDFFRSLNDSTNSVGALLNERDFYDELLLSAENLNKILAQVRQGEGTIGRLVMNNQMGLDAESLIGNLRSVSEQLLTTDGPLGVLLNDTNTARDLQNIMDDLALLIGDARKGKGVLGRILQDENVARQFSDIVANLDAVLQKANDPNAGALGAITSDPQVAQDLKATVANLRDVTDSLTRQEGLIGALINDKDMAVRFRRILTQVSRALEDAREAAPIGNFVQVLLGTF